MIVQLESSLSLCPVGSHNEAPLGVSEIVIFGCRAGGVFQEAPTEFETARSSKSMNIHCVDGGRAPVRLLAS